VEGGVVLDGGMATELEAAGYALDTPLWSAAVLRSTPAAVRAVHDSWLAAGARIIETASYQISRAGFEHEGYDGWDATLRASVAVARDAVVAATGVAAAGAAAAAATAALPPLVALSCGPLGAVFHDGSEYTGAYGLQSAAAATEGAAAAPPDATLVPRRQTRATMAAFHRERLVAAAGAPFDVVAFETIPCAEEAVAIGELLAAEFPHLRAWVAFSIRDGTTLVSGESLADAAAGLMAAGRSCIVGVGVNCCHPAVVTAAVTTLAATAAAAAAHLHLPTPPRILVYPNRGEVWDAATGTWSCRPWSDPLSAVGTPTDAEFLALAASWRAAGAWAVGGCCRTTPAMIRALAAAAAAAT